MTFTLINCANMGASGILVRGKQITDDFQLHAKGCQDEKAMRKIFGRYSPDAFEDFETLDAARASFDAELVDMGWEFDSSVTIKPCTHLR